ncbi:MAG TPA: ATP synthase F1 subunit epsilon [Bacteroidia bacterium]|jgi:F-type H+-transporting ATPase subunit epsilon|nr:ATP synthase F1 subunit epsilon [Bacteroidia bacterium]
MYLEILTPDKKLFSGDAEYVDVPGRAGRTGILRNHAPLISSLKAGKVKVRDMAKQEHFFEIKGGIMEVRNDKVIVLAE